MTLVDAGPLVAILDRDDHDHHVCVRALQTLTAPLITTWPAFTEAMYLLGDRVGWAGQEALWRLTIREDLELQEFNGKQLKRCRDLMKKYQDLPMDLADATLVVLAEWIGLRSIFTLDKDFRVYRIQGRKTFELVPESF